LWKIDCVCFLQMWKIPNYLYTSCSYWSMVVEGGLLYTDPILLVSCTYCKCVSGWTEVGEWEGTRHLSASEGLKVSKKPPQTARPVNPLTENTSIIHNCSVNVKVLLKYLYRQKCFHLWLSFGSPGALVPWPPMDIKIWGHPSPLNKMVFAYNLTGSFPHTSNPL
jgi:hypothetical protein